MVRNLVVEIELAEPAVSKVQGHFLAQPPLVTNAMAVTDQFLYLEWRETEGPTISLPGKTGFGVRLLSRPPTFGGVRRCSSSQWDSSVK